MRELLTELGRRRVFRVVAGSWPGILGLLSVGLLTGCIALPHRYHFPEAPTGTPIRNGCATIIGPRETLEFRLDGVELRVRGGARRVDVRLVVPAGHAVVLTSDEALMTRNGRDERLALRGFTYWDSRARTNRVIAPGDPLVGSARMHLHLRLPRPGAGDYALQLPAVRIDGTPHEVPAITFVRRWTFGAYLILLNC
jgi:hypothetical protein